MKKEIILKRHDRSEEQLIKAVEQYCKSKNVVYSNLIIDENKVSFTTYSNISYENLVAQLVAEKYSLTEENAIQRKAIMYGITDEFHIYNAYVEQCKLDAKAFIEERNKAMVV